jgi:hypothetical protein
MIGARHQVPMRKIRDTGLGHCFISFFSLDGIMPDSLMARRKAVRIASNASAIQRAVVPEPRKLPYWNEKTVSASSAAGVY